MFSCGDSIIAALIERKRRRDGLRACVCMIPYRTVRVVMWYYIVLSKGG